MGWFGSESRFSSDNSTGTRCLAKAANSSAGNCDRIVLRGLVEFTGVEMWPVGTAAPLREDYCLWPQRPLPTYMRGVWLRLPFTIRRVGDICLCSTAHKAFEI